ncbi:cation diffusion facilitator family transporter [Sporomusaceae bacterium BoRhaA]|uniref:cation diffusion facilitator family transporter n=1 Tax=Pelorhabdus rhamnosifermentans TaxID=2772457 RepID=UPI001C063C1B|nr:cation diffusion facilitator family transporter [Pelorhabdus rhamnosifermentans]MBU2703510.1 cation diffusion facilitator family transporter [Pelorhabdus rhamnosifermentans]
MVRTNLITKLNNKTTASLLAILSNCILISVKFLIAGISGSVSILSEAIHSGMDLLASLIVFFSIRLSAEPANESFPFGYGKIENISALLEGILLFAAALIIIAEAIPKIIYPVETAETYLAIGVMSISTVINFLISSHLYKVAKSEDSMALAADAAHLRTDTYSSLGVAVGIILMRITGLHIIDPIIAVIVAMLITKAAYNLSRNALVQLLDARIPPEQCLKIKEVLERCQDKIINYHEIKTRKAGNNTFINLHITVDKNLTVKESHALEDFIESELELVIKNAYINIHVDPS